MFIRFLKLVEYVISELNIVNIWTFKTSYFKNAQQFINPFLCLIIDIPDLLNL